MCAAMTMQAQIETMTKRTFKADPMINDKAYTSWTSRHVQIIEEADGDTYIELRNPPRIFSEWFSIKVGLYTSSGKMIDMSEKWHCGVSEDETTMWLKFGFSKDESEYTDTIPPGSIKTQEGTQYELARIEKYTRIMRASDVLRFLKKTSGYIRITTPVYGGQIMDVKAKISKSK